MVTTEAELLQQRAENGDSDAQMTLAILLDNRGMHDHAINWLRAASNNGYTPAQFVLGARLVVGRAAPYEPEEGAKWISTAAQSGMPEALALMSVLAAMADQWNEAVNLAKDAAKAGDARCGEMVTLLGDLNKFNPRQWDTPYDIKFKHKSPRVGVIENFIPASFCAWMIKRAKPKLETVRVKDPNQGRGIHADYRTNSGAGFSLIETDLIMQMVNARVAGATEIPVSNQEPLNILHYKPGEEYKAHYDFITASDKNAMELQTVGQRACTVLIYLNDDYDGGETDFPSLKWKFKGKAGDALVFWNLDDKGQPEKKTLHAGLPVKKGEKWLYSKWIRANPYPLI